MSQASDSNDLALLGNKVLSAFRIALDQFGRLDDDRGSPSPSETACKIESQRFQLWSFNLDILHFSHNSLDHRLCLNENVRTLVVALLTDLCLALDDRK